MKTKSISDIYYDDIELELKIKKFAKDYARFATMRKLNASSKEMKFKELLAYLRQGVWSTEEMLYNLNRTKEMA